MGENFPLFVCSLSKTSTQTISRSGVIATATDRRDEDRELAARAGAGDQGAFTILFERYKAGIYRYCLLMTGIQVMAEDIYQEVFISFYRACRDGTTMFNVHGYLIRSARNRCLNALQRSGRTVSIDDIVEPSYECDPSDFETSEYLRQALDAIPPHYRDAFLLFEFEGLSYDEIAEHLEVTHDVVKNRIYRAKQALQKLLAPLLKRGK